MNPSPDIRDEEPIDEVTQLLPAELIQFSSYSQGSVPSDGVEAKKISPEDPTVQEEGIFVEEDEEPTVMELIRIHPSLPKKQNIWTRLYHFMLDPHYTPEFPSRVKSYLRQTRENIHKSKEYHRTHFPNTLDQKLLRLLKRGYLRFKSNLLEKYE